MKLSTLAQTCNPSYLGGRDPCSRPARAKKFERSHLNGEKLDVVVYTCHHSRQEA
jgi:hypothetical protein